jgi:hypothetical protein
MAAKVGSKVASKASRYLLDPALQTGVEAVVNPDIKPGESATQFAVGSALGAALPFLGNQISQGATETLVKDFKFTPTDQQKKFGPHLNVLFEEKQIPWFGGREGIVKNVEKVVEDLNIDRRAYMQSELDKAMQEIEANKFNPEFTNGAGVNSSSVNIKGMKEKLFADVDKNMQLEPPEREALKKLIAEKIDYLYYDNPFMRTYSEKPVNSGPFAFLQTPGADAQARELNVSKVNKNLIPLILASDRRSGWFNQGKVNKGVPKNEANEAKAANMLWGEMSQRLAENPTYKAYSGKMAKYVPIEQALERRAGALNNRYSLPIDITALPGGIVRRAWQSNPSLITRYNLGKNVEKAKPTVYMTPIFTGDEEQK